MPNISIDQASVGPQQIRILEILWEHGPSTVYDVLLAINESRKRGGSPEIVYTTALTILRNLSRRGIVNQLGGEKGRGRSHLFAPAFGRDEYLRAMARQFVGTFFGGQVDNLIAAHG